MSIRHKPRRKKRYVPRPIRTPMLIGAELAMRPLEQIIEQMAREGTINEENGVPVFLACDGDWYQSAEAIEGMIWHLEMYCDRHGWTLPLDPLRNLHRALIDMEPIGQGLLADLLTSMPHLRRAMSLANPEDQLDLLRQTQIKAELQRNEVAA